MILDWKIISLQHNKSANILLYDSTYNENHRFITWNRRFCRNFQYFRIREIKIGVGVPSKMKIDEKDTGFELFIYILDDPENLSKKYYQSSEKSWKSHLIFFCKKNPMLTQVGTLILRSENLENRRGFLFFWDFDLGKNSRGFLFFWDLDLGKNSDLAAKKICFWAFSPLKTPILPKKSGAHCSSISPWHTAGIFFWH